MALLLQHTEFNQPARKIPLFRILTRVGSGPDNDIIIAHPDVQEDHATILKEKGCFFLAIVGRGRLVYINGKKIKKERLQNGDVIAIGDQSYTFYEEEPLSAQPNPDQVSELQAYRKIVSFSRDLLSTKDLNSLLTKLLDIIVDLTKADRACLLLFENGAPKVVLSRNIEQQEVVGSMAQLSDTIIAKVVKEKQPLIVDDALSHKEFKMAASVMNLRLNSVMCVPLLDSGELLGLIYVGSNQAVNLFGQKELGLLTVFGAQASLLIKNAQQKAILSQDNFVLRQKLDNSRFGQIIGACPAMETIYRTITKIAATDISVLVTGETGTGKELIARELHRCSNRAKGPFVVINCGAIPENLLESELFGHVRGAFTGATATRNGKFQEANGGTLFLDEIGELPLNLQVKLLRALQERQVTKVGSNSVENINIRVVAATNKDLQELIKQGAFREDLYYRLNVVSVHLPPLRERGDDLLTIGNYFLKRYAAEYNSQARDFNPQAVAAMKHYSWPGNIRQLENRIKRAVVMAERSQLTVEDLDLEPSESTHFLTLDQAKEEFQRQYINESLRRNNGNRTKTAKELGVDPRTIFRYLEREVALNGEKSDPD